MRSYEFIGLLASPAFKLCVFAERTFIGCEDGVFEIVKNSEGKYCLQQVIPEELSSKLQDCSSLPDHCT